MTESIDVRRIMSVIPHRYPFLLVDRVLEMKKLERVVAIKNVSINEPYFAGHFPAHPVMPGVLIVEALAQASAVLFLSEIEDRESRLVVFTGIDACRFRRPVVPGDVLRLEVEALNIRSRAAKMKGIATVEGELCCEATLLCGMVDRGAVR